ncbi:hypothetical protein N0V82_000205 [Gnomoniopsis sp. IMI 355080]|nr:hypothetical protein N0V82_000205 [Gnomoniopsis sp. IMI 355080]
MCPGTATKLLCSHYLVQWSGPRCPKKCVLPDHRTFLPCTCAPCDQSFNQRQIRLKYTAERETLSARISIAMMEGWPISDVRQLEWQLRGVLRNQMDDLKRTRVPGLDPAVGCRWPGMYEQWVQENLGRPVDWDSLLNK